MSKPQLQNYRLLKFEQQQIIFYDPLNHTHHQYFETELPTNSQQINSCPHIESGKSIGEAIIYPKCQTNIEVEFTKKIKQQNKTGFTQQEICNTFIPVIEALEYAKKCKTSMGNVVPQNIIINQKGYVQLRNKKISNYNDLMYYPKNKTEKQRDIKDDFRALAIVMVEVAIMQRLSLQEKQNDGMKYFLKQLNSLKFSKEFIVGIYIMKQGLQKYYDQLPLIFESKKLSTQLQEQSKKWLQPEAAFDHSLELKPSFTPPLLTHTQQLAFSPKRFTNIKKTHNNPHQKHQDLQNKKLYQQQIKKKMNQKLLKFDNREKTGRKVNDIALKKMSNVKVTNMIEIDNINFNTIKKGRDKESSPAPMRLKTLSKKKC